MRCEMPLLFSPQERVAIVDWTLGRCRKRAYIIVLGDLSPFILFTLV